MTTVAVDYPIHYVQHQRIAAIVCVSLTAIGVLLLCVGVGTPAWHIDYDNTLLIPIPQWYTNLFYTCYAVNNTCYTNQNILPSGVSVYAQPISQTTPVSTDYYLRLRNAAGLSIVGLLFLAFGSITALFLLMPSLHFNKFDGRLNLISALLLAVAALFQRAALSEGQHVMTFNGSSANLYQTGHALTIFAIPICAFIAGRMRNRVVV